VHTFEYKFEFVHWYNVVQVTEATTPLAHIPYREQVQKKQKEVLLIMQELEDVGVFYFFI
jgi:hypothetical protein